MNFEWLALAFYMSGLILLSLYGFHRYIMVYLFNTYVEEDPPLPPPPEEWPVVTIQLPIYNEQYVVESLVDAVVHLDYPREKLEIQVLDDSTDETTVILERLVRRYKKEGFWIELYHRSERKGYKAGALHEGLKRAHGEYIAIFDADFKPPRDFLKKTIPYFRDPRLALVQTRWEYENRHASLLTRVEAMMLDGHFVIEHSARNASGRFFNFNGTAGVWRKEAIFDGGGWQGDTLTEDLDLSYRVQMKGWKFLYLKDTVVYSELPVEMAAFKQQQFRWAKGSLQTARKLLLKIWRAPLPFKVKAEAFFHLTANVSYPLMLWVGIWLGPSIWARYRLGLYEFLWLDIPIFCLATLSVVSFYVTAERNNPQGIHSWKDLIVLIPFLMALGIGLSLLNTRAVFEGVRGIASPFQRTPKYGELIKKGVWVRQSKYRLRQYFLPMLEIIMAGLFATILYFCYDARLWASLPFVSLFLLGYGYTGLMTLWQGWKGTAWFFRVGARLFQRTLKEAYPHED